MSKIASAFANGKAFIAFITCGDPDLETTGAAVRAAVENGADLIELGIRGFWNFTNVELSSPVDDVKFENIHFADSLLTLSYRIANR